jgi:hypothetical protein
LLWESQKVVRGERPPVAARYPWLPLSRAVLDQLRDGRELVMCLPFFQEVRDWCEDADECGGCGVCFELEGVSLLPVLRRTVRGFALVPGVGVLAPLTPLRIRLVAPIGLKERTVWLSGVAAGGCVLGGLGRRSRGCRSGFEMASAEYHRGRELFFKREDRAAMGAWERAAKHGHSNRCGCWGSF